MQAMQVALVQMHCEKAAIDANLTAIATFIADGARRGVDVICFPEMSITGYIDPTRQQAAMLRLDGPEVAQFVALTAGTSLTAIAGLVEANPAGKPFITQVVAGAGELRGVYRKKTIVDEEVAWFAPGSAVPVFPHPKGTFSVAICADIGNPRVFAAGARGGARVMFEAAAPGLYGPQATRDWQTGYDWWRSECQAKLGQYARDHGLFIAVATQAGRTVDEDFPGGGYVFAPDGSLIAATNDWSEQVLYAALPVGVAGRP